jgi:hypothetical protein
MIMLVLYIFCCQLITKRMSKQKNGILFARQAYCIIPPQLSIVNFWKNFEGCCGTTPDNIRLIKAAVEKFSPVLLVLSV